MTKRPPFFSVSTLVNFSTPNKDLFLHVQWFIESPHNVQPFLEQLPTEYDVDYWLHPPLHCRFSWPRAMELKTYLDGFYNFSNCIEKYERTISRRRLNRGNRRWSNDNLLSFEDVYLLYENDDYPLSFNVIGYITDAAYD
jgi:hypothetical protein